MRTDPATRCRSGFTLTEILAVLSIISLLATLSVPPLKSYIQRLEFCSGLRQSSQLLRRGQVLARSEWRPHRLSIENKMLLLQRKNGDQWVSTGIEFRPPSGMSLGLNQRPVFYPSGAVVPLCTLSISLGRRSARLTLSAAGRIRVQGSS